MSNQGTVESRKVCPERYRCWEDAGVGGGVWWKQSLRWDNDEDLQGRKKNENDEDGVGDGGSVAIALRDCVSLCLG